MRRGLTLESRILKVLKAMAALEDLTINELLERIVAKALEGKTAFSEEELKSIRRFATLYGLTTKAPEIEKSASGVADA